MDADRLLDAVIAAPDDDAPRRVYADWLLAHGDAARGELIQVQCDLAGLDPEDDRRQVRDRVRALRRRQWALLQDHGARWVAEAGLDERLELTRGFPGALRIDHKITWLLALPRVGGSPLRALIEAVEAQGGEAMAPELVIGAARAGILPRLRRLRLYVRPWTAALSEALARSPWSATLTDLSISTGGDRIGPALVSGLFAGGAFSGLRALRIEDVRTAEAAAALVAVDHLHELRRLEIGRYTSADACAVLARWTDRFQLDELAYWPMGDGAIAAMRALLEGPLLDGVRRLQVPWPTADDEVVRILRDRRAGLIHATILDCKRGEDGALRLLATRGRSRRASLPELRRLRLLDPTRAVIEAMTVDSLPRLRSLDVYLTGKSRPERDALRGPRFLGLEELTVTDPRGLRTG